MVSINILLNNIISKLTIYSRGMISVDKVRFIGYLPALSNVYSHKPIFVCVSSAIGNFIQLTLAVSWYF